MRLHRGGPGVGKRTLARLAGAVREAMGEVVIVDGAAEGKPAIPPGARPATWLVLNADRVPRPIQLEIAHAVGRGGGATIIATTNQPLDRATGDGHIAPWFATLFSGKRITVPSLEARREDILPTIVREICDHHGIPLDRLTPELLEAIVRSGWPGGVPQLEAALVSAAEAAPEGPLSIASIAGALSRAAREGSLAPPSTDPSPSRAAPARGAALARCANGSVASAARSLGMSRQAIYREADRLGLDIARRGKARGVASERRTIDREGRAGGNPAPGAPRGSVDDARDPPRLSSPHHVRLERSHVPGALDGHPDHQVRGRPRRDLHREERPVRCRRRGVHEPPALLVDQLHPVPRRRGQPPQGGLVAQHHRRGTAGPGLLDALHLAGRHLIEAPADELDAPRLDHLGEARAGGGSLIHAASSAPSIAAGGISASRFEAQ